MTCRVLLKARPTVAQLDDRLRAPRPEGLELYLDTADLASTEAMDGVVARLDERGLLSSDFSLLVEGPIRSLDGEFWDLGRDSEADRELSRRIVALSRRIGAVGANVHAIAPDPDPRSLTRDNRRAVLDRAVAPTRYFAELALAVGIVPTIENMPPILRMRESGFFYSAIGMPPQDLTELAERVPGLGIILDTSHAQLYLNVRGGVDLDLHQSVPGPPAEGQDGHDWSPLRRFVADLPGPTTMAGYLDVLGDRVFASHIANAAGLLGEGLPYGQGDLDLDALMPALGARARYLVTETLEPNNDRADLMRDARVRILRALGRT